MESDCSQVTYVFFSNVARAISRLLWKVAGFLGALEIQGILDMEVRAEASISVVPYESPRLIALTPVWQWSLLKM